MHKGREEWERDHNALILPIEAAQHKEVLRIGDGYINEVSSLENFSFQCPWQWTCSVNQECRAADMAM